MHRSIDIRTQKPMELMSASAEPDRIYLKVVATGYFEVTTDDVLCGGPEKLGVDFQLDRQSACRLFTFLKAQLSKEEQDGSR